jgi:uncharacterized pyridoxamine 5'-phosphate oxidase family protein
MNKATKFLNDCQTFYVATLDAGRPRVRPFGAVCEYNGKTYISTNNTKKVFNQIKSNPKVEICGVAPDGKWIRIQGDAIADPDIKAKEEMLETNPVLKSMYSSGDEIFEVLRLERAKATISSFVDEPEEFMV